MPIPVKDLQEHQQPLAGRVLDFLNGKRGEAFTVHEIAREVEGYGDDRLLFFFTAYADPALMARYRAAMGILQLAGKVQGGQVRGEVYYAAR